MKKTNTRRVIGIRHRVKRTAEGESRPTQLVIKVDDSMTKLNLDNEEAELNFLRTGLLPNDICLMSLGGSGDRLAFAISRQMELSEGCLLRLPPRLLKERRDLSDGNKDDDAQLLIEQFEENPQPFVVVEPRDRLMISARESFRSWEDSMKARIACEQRIHSSLIGSIYCSEEGGYPEGKIEQIYEKAKANDVILQNLLKEESRREREMTRALEKLPVYRELFKPIVGVGPKIAGRIVTAIGDVRLFIVQPDEELMKQLKDRCDEIERTVFDPLLPQLTGVFAKRSKDWAGANSGELRFYQLGAAAQWLRQQGRPDEAVKLQEAIELHQQRSNARRTARQKGRAKLKAFCGVHLVKNDQDEWIFARKRRGQVCNWNPQVRQAIYLFGEQINRRPNTVWGQLQRDYKAKLQAKYPEPIEVNGKKRYSKAHIHRMATWKALSKFVEHLFDEWCKLEHVSG